ncbi:MAG: hypothetical protein OEM64_08185 [Gammaproteobacteria bacterium]|jgi:tetratricopeptide (TPR) repeat protein|nr:hypothetical protein [Gammaproteobacteria bacterium]MDH3416269.1 hypothetical protein [Gammaproteobacteria bacterium]
MKHSRNIFANMASPRSIATLIMALFCMSTIAAADEPVYTMITMIDMANGAEVVAGKYEQAVEKITAKKGAVDAFSYNTNLCVAYTKLGDIENASLACEAAIEEASSIRVVRQSEFSRSFQRHTKKKYLAFALSNRGVLRAAMGDVELARQDFVEALTVDTRISAAKINLARLGRSEA